MAQEEYVASGFGVRTFDGSDFGTGERRHGQTACMHACTYAHMCNFLISTVVLLHLSICEPSGRSLMP